MRQLKISTIHVVKVDQGRVVSHNIHTEIQDVLYFILVNKSNKTLNHALSSPDPNSRLHIAIVTPSAERAHILSAVCVFIVFVFPLFVLNVYIQVEHLIHN